MRVEVAEAPAPKPALALRWPARSSAVPLWQGDEMRQVRGDGEMAVVIGRSSAGSGAPAPSKASTCRPGAALPGSGVRMVSGVDNAAKPSSGRSPCGDRMAGTKCTPAEMRLHSLRHGASRSTWRRCSRLDLGAIVRAASHRLRPGADDHRSASSHAAAKSVPQGSTLHAVGDGRCLLAGWSDDPGASSRAGAASRSATDRPMPIRAILSKGAGHLFAANESAERLLTPYLLSVRW